MDICVNTSKKMRQIFFFHMQFLRELEKEKTDQSFFPFVFLYMYYINIYNMI